jgi:hypothetical protein
MRGAACYEMDYLRAAQGRNREDVRLAQELGRQLDALRRYDQLFGDSDWRPRKSATACELRPKDATG